MNQFQPPGETPQPSPVLKGAFGVYGDITPEEVKEITRLWYAQDPMTASGSTIGDVAEGLTIPEAEVQRLLAEVRKPRATQVRVQMPMVLPPKQAQMVRLSAMMAALFLSVGLAFLLSSSPRHSPVNNIDPPAVVRELSRTLD